MTFLGFKLGKLILFGIAAFAWGWYCSATGRDLTGRRKQPESDTPGFPDDQQR
jgi:hypothetical protein